jgi:hypothetical protein
LGVPKACAHQPVKDWRLVAAGEEGEAFGGGVAQGLQPGDGGGERLVPGDLLERAGAARADAAERRLEAGGRGDLLDACRALGAEDALVHRVVAVAFDVGDAALLATCTSIPQRQAHM